MVASLNLRINYRMTVVIMLLLYLLVGFSTAITLENTKIMTDVELGKTYVFPFTLSLKPTETADDYSIDVMGFGQGPEGNYIALQPVEDPTAYSARTYLSTSTSLVHVDSGGRQSVDIKINVPQNAGTGGRYAIVLIRSAQKPGSTGTTIGTALQIPVMLTLKGTSLTQTGAITNVQAEEAIAGKPVVIQTTLKNTGNHHFYGAFVNVTVTDSGGNLVATASSSTIFALIPGNEMMIKTPIRTALPSGTYTVKSEAKIAEGIALLDTKTVSFTVGGPSTPAPTPTVSEAPTQAVSEVPTALTMVVSTEQSPVAPGAIATRAPISIMSVMLALAAVSGILVLKRKG